MVCSTLCATRCAKPATSSSLTGCPDRVQGPAIPTTLCRISVRDTVEFRGSNLSRIPSGALFAPDFEHSFPRSPIPAVFRHRLDRSPSRSVKYFLAFRSGIELMVMTSPMPRAALKANTNRLRTVRLQLRLSQLQFATLLGVSVETYRAWDSVGAWCPTNGRTRRGPSPALMIPIDSGPSGASRPNSAFTHAARCRGHWSARRPLPKLTPDGYRVLSGTRDPGVLGYRRARSPVGSPSSSQP